MKLQVSFDIECGETTCASEPGKFCKFLGTIHFGCTPVCTLFNPTDHQMCRGEDILILSTRAEGERDGWVQRCPECMEQAK